MLRSRIFFVLACAAASSQLLPAATTIIMEGSVTMIDGSVPPKPAGLERDCTGTTPDAGPITDKQGQYVWRLSSELTNGRACFVQAQLAGFISTRFDLTKLGLSDYIGTHTLTLPT